ncbi:MAG TPA: adenosine deaminase, partial [Pseudolysinimonas sp.]
MSDAAAALPGSRLPIRDLPKVSLHDHLDGGLRPQTIIELADPLGIELPATEPAALANWFAEQADSGSLVEYLKTFAVTISVMQTREGLVRVARDFVEDLVTDGVVYGEIRWAPEQHLERGLTLYETVEAVQEGIDEAVSAAFSAGHRIQVGQLVSAMRHLERGTEIAELALRHRDNGVVGFDIAGPEAGYPAARQREAFDLLANAWFPATVHAGEADGLESIRGALIDGRALRLGHGVRIAEDITIEGEDDESQFVTLGPLAQWVKDRGITLECSPSSNLQTGAFAAWGSTMADHPIDMLYQLGFRVTVNTDNRLMSATTLTRELGILVDTFGYDADDVLAFQLNAAEAA